MSNFRWEGTEISPSLFFIFGRHTVPAKMHGGCHCCQSETVSFVVSLLSRDVPCECSISECLVIVPLTRHQFWTKSGQFNGCIHACLHENSLASENPEKRRAYSTAFSSKMWYSRVICVFLRWGLTYTWHVLWGKLSFNFVIWLKCRDPCVLFNLFLFDFVAILNWLLSNRLYIHLVMIIMDQLAWLLPSCIAKLCYCRSAL